MRATHVVWDAHESIATSATFTSYADNTVVTSITFIVRSLYNAYLIFVDSWLICLKE